MFIKTLVPVSFCHLQKKSMVLVRIHRDIGQNTCIFREMVPIHAFNMSAIIVPNST